MKKLILLTVVVGVLIIAANAIANSTPGYITNGNMTWVRNITSGSTWQEWDFINADPLNPFNPASPEGVYNPYGDSTAKMYEVPVANPVTPFGWHSSYLGRTGVWAGDAIYADIVIPNTPVTDGYKVVWMEIGFAAAVIDQSPIIQPYIAGGQAGNFQWQQLSMTIVQVGDTNWHVMNVGWIIDPNPQSETITFGFAGSGGFIDYVTVDTLCVVPIPGAIVLCGIGVGLVGWMRRRKSIV